MSYYEGFIDFHPFKATFNKNFLYRIYITKCFKSFLLLEERLEFDLWIDYFILISFLI